MRIGQIIAVFTLLATGLGQAEVKWIDPSIDEGWQVEGRIWQEEGYGRLPAKAKGVVRDAVWWLGQQSAGLKVRFWSNSPEIQVRYELTGTLSMPHMPASGVSGFDLYRRTTEGEQFWVGAIKPGAAKGDGKKLIKGLSPDQLHPNATGYARMAEKCAQYLGW